MGNFRVRMAGRYDTDGGTVCVQPECSIQLQHPLFNCLLDNDWCKGGVHCWSNVGADLVCSKGFKPLPKQFDHNYTTFNSLLTNQTTILCLLYPAMPPIFQHLHFILSFYAKAKVIVCRFISANWLKAIND